MYTRIIHIDIMGPIIQLRPLAQSCGELQVLFAQIETMFRRLPSESIRREMEISRVR